jgi:dUTP pyrophosphatase
MKIRILKTHPDAKAPQYSSDGSGCFDLKAVTVNGAHHTDTIVKPWVPVTCDTGLVFEIPDGHVMLIFSRSGHGFHHRVHLSNCVGVIDADYRGSVQVQLTSHDNRPENIAGLEVRPGDRVAQAMVIPAERVEFEVAEQLTLTERGEGGFGSTGR